MFVKVLNFILLVGYATASIFNGIQDTKHDVKHNFSEGISRSPKLYASLNLKSDNVSNSLDSLIKNQIRNKFSQTVDDVIEQLIEVGFETMRTVNEVKHLVKEIFAMLENLSIEINDVLQSDNESQEPNQTKVQEFYNKLTVEIVDSNNERKFESYYGFEELVKPFKDKAYNVTEQISEKIDQLGRVGQKWNHWVEIYQSSIGQLKKEDILAKLIDQFITNLDVNAIKNLAKSHNQINHPLVAVMVEITKHKNLIINALLKRHEESYYNDPNDINSVCVLVKMILNKETIDNLIKFIHDKLELKFQNKLEMALKSGGTNALNYILNPICNGKSQYMALVFLELADTLFPMNTESDYKLQERIFQFIEWITFVVQYGIESSNKRFDNLSDSAKELMKILKDNNQLALLDALDLFEPFKKQFQGLFDDIEKELKTILNSQKDF